MLAADVIHIRYAQEASQLFRGHFHRSGRRCFARLWLRESSGTCGVKCDVTLDLLHGLMNVSVENGHGAKLFQVPKGLRAVLGSPSPFRINRPQRDMRENDDGRAGLEMLHVFFEPLELLVSKRSQSSRFQIHYVHQTNEVHALLFKDIPKSMFEFMQLCDVIISAEEVVKKVFCINEDDYQRSAKNH